MVPSRHRLRSLPQRRQRGQPLDRHPQQRRPVRRRHHTLMPAQLRLLLLRRRKRRPEHLQRRLQAMAADERPGADVEFRARLGLVLLDLGHGERGAVELEGGYGCGDPAEEDVGSEFQLFEFGAGFQWFAGDVLKGGHR